MNATGRHNALTDIPGILVGHATRIGGGALTGSTVVLLPPGCVVSVDVRGGGPCTRETAPLDPRQGGSPVDAITLSGGSVYGLSAAHGVQRWLAEHRPADRAPVVPAAGLFDLGRGGDFHAHPDAALGAAAAAGAAAGPITMGNVGAGAGAVNAGMKGGLGTASVLLPGGPDEADEVVAALVAVNASGPAVDPDTGLPHGAPAGLPGEFALRAPEPDALADGRRRLAEAVRGRAALRPMNTVIGLVATTARVDPVLARRLAAAAQDGLAVAVRPAHGLTEGDSVFAVGTGASGEVRSIERLLDAAATVFTRAMVHGVLAAESVTTPWGHIPAYRELYPSTIV
jgi:L-aminopeptidase/D-esterase-like protein